MTRMKPYSEWGNGSATIMVGFLDTALGSGRSSLLARAPSLKNIIRKHMSMPSLVWDMQKSLQSTTPTIASCNHQDLGYILAVT